MFTDDLSSSRALKPARGYRANGRFQILSQNINSMDK